MKAKVIDVHYRKDSQTFPQWMKYEITLLYEDGTTEKIPAYGRDLQDALSRVVHDQKVQKLNRRVSQVPVAVWLLLWFSYLGILILAWEDTQNHWILLGGLGGVIAVFLNLNWWGRLRNRNRN